MISNNGQWTRNDLPAPSAIRCVDDGTALDRIVDHLNAHHPKPDDQCEDCGVDEALKMVGDLGRGMMRAQNQRAEFRRERDAAVARAEQAESRVRLANQQSVEWEGEAERLLCERDEWKARAEAAEARTVPAVSRADVERVVHRYIDGGFDELHVSRVKSTTDAFMALLSGDDPAVYVVRESDLPLAVRDDDGSWVSGDSRYSRRATAEGLRRDISGHLEMIANREAVARAIEHEAVVDPVEAKARVEADRRYSGDPNHAFIEGAVWAARHLNEQEATR